MPGIRYQHSPVSHLFLVRMRMAQSAKGRPHRSGVWPDAPSSLQHRCMNPRATRYWELVSIPNGKTGMASKVEDWNWIKAAVLHHFA
jgi:hypothetical protein